MADLTPEEQQEYSRLKEEEWQGNHYATDAALGESAAGLRSRLNLMRVNKAARCSAARAVAESDEAKWAQYAPRK